MRLAMQPDFDMAEGLQALLWFKYLLNTNVFYHGLGEAARYRVVINKKGVGAFGQGLRTAGQIVKHKACNSAVEV